MFKIVNSSEPVKRQGVKVVHDKQSNRHYLNQFGLLLLQTSLKVGKVKLDDDAVIGHIDGIIADLIDMLVLSRHTSEQAKILRIFTRLFKHPGILSALNLSPILTLAKCRKLIKDLFKLVLSLLNQFIMWILYNNTRLNVQKNYS